MAIGGCEFCRAPAHDADLSLCMDCDKYHCEWCFDHQPCMREHLDYWAAHGEEAGPED